MTESYTKEVEQRNETPKHNPEQEEGRETLASYFRGVRAEMKKVVWPTKQELGSYTVVVLVSCIVFALLFWGLDSGILAILKSLLGITMQ